MKKKFILPAVLGAALLAACQPVEPEKTEEFGTLTINLTNPALQTKSDITALTCESKVNKMRVLIFDGTGSLFADKNLDSPYNSLTVSGMRVGQYSAYAVANSCAALPSTVGAVTTAGDLAAKAVTLADCSTDENTGFVMYDSKQSFTVGSGQTASQVSMSVTRFPARIRLVSVSNGLPDYRGDLTVERVMLINGYGTWNLAGSGSPTASINAAGRNATSGEVITAASGADYPDHTFWAVPSDAKVISHSTATKTYNHNFYSFPNAAEIDVVQAGVGGGKMRLVVAASVGGTLYYYPVTLTNVERNKSYDVKLTISGLGSEDPNVPVRKGSANFSVTVKSWEPGTDYTETI